MKIIIHTDGGARGNPGPAAIGVVIEATLRSGSEQASDRGQETRQGKKVLSAFGKTIGETTNNVAEYTAVIEALKKIQNSEFRIQNEKLEVGFFLDSLLVVQQLNGIWKIKDARLRELLSQIRMLEQEVGAEVTYSHVRREQNAAADALVNEALDSRL